MPSLFDRLPATGPTLRRAKRIVVALLLGLIGTATSALILLNLIQPIQALVYDAVYLQIGPSEATEAAILTHFLVAGFTALGVALVLGDYWSDRLAHKAALGKAAGMLLVLLLGFLGAALVGLAAMPTALIVVGIAVVAIPLVMRFRFGVRTDGTIAFVGGSSVVIVLLFLAGFGIGWGWGYVVTAQEVPAATVNQTAVSFEEVPEVQDDLFAAGDCRTDTNDRRVCHLQLRGYEHELTTIRFLDRHGVRCPYQRGRSGRSGNPFARVDGVYYRIHCAPHGD